MNFSIKNFEKRKIPRFFSGNKDAMRVLGWSYDYGPIFLRAGPGMIGFF